MYAPTVAYVYLVLLVADVLCALLALARKNNEHFCVFAVLALWFFIGYSDNTFLWGCFDVQCMSHIGY
jgi:hypothetical protein